MDGSVVAGALVDIASKDPGCGCEGETLEALGLLEAGAHLVLLCCCDSISGGCVVVDVLVVGV